MIIEVGKKYRYEKDITISGKTKEYRLDVTVEKYWGGLTAMISMDGKKGTTPVPISDLKEWTEEENDY
ncbi:hypothetical protein [Exiguobacterium sp. S22-S28]|uniref:hypothetical protein n=1 Tax=Exiguobacterium sp. S22-S28 TaxID=3342768 RepID=UPI00372D7BF8